MTPVFLRHLRCIDAGCLDLFLNANFWYSYFVRTLEGFAIRTLLYGGWVVTNFMDRIVLLWNR